MSDADAGLMTIFTAALERADAAERAAYLDRACGSDAELRQRVEALLAAHAGAGRFLEPDGPGAFAPHAATLTSGDPAATGSFRPGASPEEAEGAIIAGRYKLRQKIGEGGMGTVWMADQTEPIKRKVAVKLIRVERGQSKTILARFEAERQAIALMDHPHIAKLLDAGSTDAGAPFFVMELVKGIPLNEFCDQHRLTVTERLNLFMQICGAVQHAHQKGIIHRDLKPSNILVESHDGKPVPKVIDFGLAKATTGLQLTEQSMFTAFGAVLGTPLYMAPEQASFNAIDVDTRADVYALGVILYELLTGTTPITRETLKKAAFDEMLRLVREQEAPTPSSRLSSSDSLPSVSANRQTEPQQLGRFVKGELDWIVLKALSKDRDRRYETANGFAKDIERFLNHEPVTAGPPTAGYRLRKFIRRNRPQVIAASLVLLALVAGMIGTTLGLLEARRQTEIARQETAAKEAAREEEARQRHLAEAEKQKAIAFRNQALDALRATTGDDVKTLIGAKKELTANEREYLEAIARRWQTFARQEGTDEQSRAIRAEGHFRVAVLWQQLGRRDEARPKYEQALAIWEKLAAEFPAVPDYRSDLAGNHNNLGVLLESLGKRTEAEEQHKKGLALLEKLAADFPTVPDYRSDLAGNHNNLGVLLKALGKRTEAEEQFRKGLALQEKLAADFPAVPDYRRILAGNHGNLGLLLHDLGKRVEAEEQFRKGLALQEKLAAEFPAVPDYRFSLGASCSNLGLLLEDLGKRAEAEEQHKKGLALREKLVAEFPTVPDYRISLAASHSNLGILLADLGKRAEAEEQHRKGLALREKLAADFPTVPEYRSELTASHNNLGVLLRELGKWAEAMEQYRKGLALREKLAADFPTVPEYRRDLAMSHTNLGVLLADLGKWAEAEEQYRKGLALREKLAAEFPAVPEYRSDLAKTQNSLGNLLQRLGKRAEAEEQYRKALAMREKLTADFPTVPDYRSDLTMSHGNLGVLLDRLGKRAEAEEQYRKGLAISEKLAADFPAVPDYRRILAGNHTNLGNLLVNIGKRAEAEEQYRKGLAVNEKLATEFPAVPRYQIDLGGSYCNLGRLVRDGGRANESLNWFDKALATLAPIHRAEPRNVIAKEFLRNSYWGRARAYDQLQKYADAVKDWDRAVELSPPDEQPGFRASRATSQANAGMVAEAIAEVAELTKSPNWTAGQWYDFACVYAVASDKIADKKSEYADRALELLQKAIKAGYKDAAHMKKDSDLDPLREREDFKKLIAELEAKHPSPKEPAPPPGEKK